MQWKQWRKQGKSYGQIVIDHYDTTGEQVTREAVIHALKRLCEGR
jgi:hypothetical protein